MIRLLILFIVLLVVWLLFKIASGRRVIDVTLEAARSVGLQEAERHIQSPILLEDYAQARGISKEELESMVSQGDIPSFRWHQYTYIENRELISKK